MDEPPKNENLPVVESGVLAASLLEDACRSALASGGSLQIEIVRDLAEDLKSSLKEMSQTNPRESSSPVLLAEAAALSADLANLAACNVSHLPETERPKAVATIYLSTGAVRACGAMVVDGTENLLRDVRSTGWRVDLATRQVESPTESS